MSQSWRIQASNFANLLKRCVEAVLHCNPFHGRCGQNWNVWHFQMVRWHRHFLPMFGPMENEWNIRRNSALLKFNYYEDIDHVDVTINCLISNNCDLLALKHRFACQLTFHFTILCLRLKPQWNFFWWFCFACRSQGQSFFIASLRSSADHRWRQWIALSATSERTCVEIRSWMLGLLCCERFPKERFVFLIFNCSKF